jgi:hypothetical protein
MPASGKMALLSHATTTNEMNDWIHHPIYTRLMAPCEPFARHALLHSIELELNRLECCPKLATRVQHFVERGVPYFAPADAHYREWAAKAASLWDELHVRSGSEQEVSLV